MMLLCSRRKDIRDERSQVDKLVKPSRVRYIILVGDSIKFNSNGKDPTMAEFTVKTSRHCEIIDITEDVNRVLPQSMPCGICHIYCPHTTAGITINENADPDVKHDVLQKLSALIPHDEAYYQHCEGNSDAHLKAKIYVKKEYRSIGIGRELFKFIESYAKMEDCEYVEVTAVSRDYKRLLDFYCELGMEYWYSELHKKLI